MTQHLLSVQGVKKKLEMATSKTKSWKDKVAQHEGLIRLIEPGEALLAAIAHLSGYFSVLLCVVESRKETSSAPIRRSQALRVNFSCRSCPRQTRRAWQSLCVVWGTLVDGPQGETRREIPVSSVGKR